MWSARPVEGLFRRLRWAADGVLIAILLVIPWVEIHGEPLIRLDIPGRKFHVLGLVIFPQELYFLWLIVAGLALALFFFTALAGRLWCGWACPQTVLTDVYAVVGRWIQGWSRSGTPAHVAMWRTLATHLVWLCFAAVLGFHLVGYFVSPYILLSNAASGALTPTTTKFLFVSTALAYLDLAFVRQTFCKYLCPYARFQSVLFDRDTLVIGYDTKRGEPRGKRGTTTGDCVDCGLCVAVCPTGIDIRNGLQLECIACTQCIDACNAVMERLDRPRNLIGYRSLVALERVRAMRILRPRVMIYGALLTAIVTVFVGAVAAREPLDLQVAHNQNLLFGSAADGRFSNAFVLHIQNRDREDHDYRIRLDAPRGFELVAGVNPVRVQATSALEARVFVLAQRDAADSAPHALASGERGLGFVLERTDNPRQRVVRNISFLYAPGSVGAGSAR
ncbi:MAG TPA: cytochrome c oxidase accessory protein CcoG [Myxococcota bacterium]|nr:cytochrome c oxidase accessory protein CcoG [Myxococcota bacterium]